jgi:hypothetical protein
MTGEECFNAVIPGALPVEWKTFAGDDLKAYQNSELTLTRDPSDWHPYNPNAERDPGLRRRGWTVIPCSR